MEEPERREAITELLADVTEESTVDIIDAVFDFWNGLRDAELKKIEEEKEKALAAAKGKFTNLLESEKMTEVSYLMCLFFFLELPCPWGFTNMHDYLFYFFVRGVP